MKNIENTKLNEKNDSLETVKNLQPNSNSDTIELKSVEQTKSDHVDETETHEKLGHRDPINQAPENNADQDATNKQPETKQIYKTFETKKELSDFVAKKIKNKADETLNLQTEVNNLKQENLALQKKVEALRNVEVKAFYQTKPQQSTTTTIEERVKGLP